MRPLARRHRFHFQVVLGICVALGGARQSRADGETPVTIAGIIKMWDARQQHAKTLDFTGQGTQSLPARAFSAEEATRPTDKNAVGFSVPASTFNIKVRYIADDKSRLRQEFFEKRLDYLKKEYVTQTSIEIHNDDRIIKYLPVSTLEFPIATILKASTAEVTKHPAVLPIWMVYRGRISGIFGKGDFVLTNDKSPVGENMCHILKCGENMVWVDPGRDFVPTRLRWIVRGVTLQTFDIQYIHDAQHGWVPSAWTVVNYYKTGNPSGAMNIKVKSFKINSSVDDGVFVPEIEPGTWVNDLTTDEKYIMRKGGDRRAIKPGEYNGHNYKQLLEQDPSP
jgi:hypothetical protein